MVFSGQGELVGAPVHGLRLRAPLDIAVFILLIASGMAGGNELAFTGCFLFGCQIAHIALVRRWLRRGKPEMA